MKKEVTHVLLKLGLLILLITSVFTFVFGVHRVQDDCMDPALKYSDVVLFDRLQKQYHANDVVVLEQNHQKQVRRIIASEGDVVDINEQGVWINGHLQQEVGIYEETLLINSNVHFPLTVEEDSYFVLSDHRMQASDSREYGCISKDNIKGKVISVLRRRGF